MGRSTYFQNKYQVSLKIKNLGKLWKLLIREKFINKHHAVFFKIIGDGPLGQKGQLSGNELKFQEQKSGIAWLRNELFK